MRSLSKSGIMFCIADQAQTQTGATAGIPLGAGTYYAKVDPGDATDTCTSGWLTTTAGW